MEAKSYKKQQERKQQKVLPSEPEYRIVHRGEMSMQDFTNERSSSRIRRPNELVVTVNLPGVESAKNVELDIFEKRLLLQCSKPLYKLDVSTLINFHDSTTVVSQASAHGCFFITHNICTRGHLHTREWVLTWDTTVYILAIVDC